MLRFLRRFFRRPESPAIERGFPVISYPIHDIEGRPVAITHTYRDGEVITIPTSNNEA